MIENKNRMIVGFCVAGGAFEDITVSCGMGGITGAIKKIELVDGVVNHIFQLITSKSAIKTGWQLLL